MSSPTARPLHQFYRALFDHYGPQHWWPGDTRLEILIGAVLTQNTNWKNVEKAIANLKAAGLIDIAALCRASSQHLAQLLRPAGYFNVKAKRLQSLIGWVHQRFDGDLDRMFAVPLGSLREELLAVKGIGRETADSILLYAGGYATFVVDAYTYRVLRRHNMIDDGADYEQIKELFESNLPDDAGMYNEYHALLVRVGKQHCRPKAQCQGCPLGQFDHDAEVAL